MIDPKQLRIGNRVNSKKGISDIIGIEPNYVSLFPVGSTRTHYNVFIEDISPIPLTDEVLIRAGFREALENAGNLPCFKRGDITIARWSNKGDWQVWKDTKDIVKIKYLHTLQNAWPILTGTELEIK